MFLIIGLGNKGKEFEKTRHNVGFIVLDQLFPEADFKPQAKFKAQTAEINLNDQKVLLVKPETMMNESGETVKALIDFYKLNPEKDLLVIHDEVESDLGEIELIEGKSAKGHNGIRSIINKLGTEQFKRLKVGVGKALQKEQELGEYVLEKFLDKDLEVIQNIGTEAREVIEEIV
ncbi:aminoacyl-tRNA hydrolase [Patescibacteria group bacterium]